MTTFTAFTDEDSDQPAGANGKTAAWRSGTERYVRSVEGDIRQLPGSGTAKGSKAVSEVVRHTLDRVGRSIRTRESAPSDPASS